MLNHICINHCDTLGTRYLYNGGIRGEGWERALLNYVDHRHTGCNLSQMTLLGLGLTKSKVKPARMPAHRLNYAWRSRAMLCSKLVKGEKFSKVLNHICINHCGNPVTRELVKISCDWIEYDEGRTTTLVYKNVSRKGLKLL